MLSSLPDGKIGLMHRLHSAEGHMRGVAMIIERGAVLPVCLADHQPGTGGADGRRFVLGHAQHSAAQTVQAVYPAAG